MTCSGPTTTVRGASGERNVAGHARHAALWVKFTSPVDVELWARRSVDRGVWWHTGRRYAFDQTPAPFARFSFAWLNERELPEAVRRLVAARPSALRRAL
jgi:GntR family transcriptional regulator/MocR family aminotransferase